MFWANSGVPLMATIQLSLEKPANAVATERGWLQQLRIGDRLVGRVLGEPREGLVPLLVRGLRINAPISGRYPPGTELALRVIDVGPRLVLHVEAPVTATAQPSLSGLPAELASPQLALARVFQTLLSPVAEHSPAAAALRSALPPADELVRPDGLRSALRSSGLWLEASLAAALSGAAVPQGDLKALLANLLMDLRRRQPLSGGAQRSSPALFQELESALLALNANQLKSLPPDPGQPQNWVLTLPFGLHGEARALHMTVSRKEPGSSTEERPEGALWRVQLQLQLPRLGKLDVDLRLQGDRVTVSMNSPSDAGLSRLAGGRERLAQCLDTAGLQLETLRLTRDQHVGDQV